MKRVALSVVGVAALVAVSVSAIQGTQAPTCEPITDTGYSVTYADSRPVCTSAGWTVNAADLPEDAYGWNCWIDGNGGCGELVVTSAGCLTDSGDGYTMCRDGRVFRLVDGERFGQVLRTIGGQS